MTIFEHAITLGDVLKVGAIAGGTALILGGVIYVMAAFGRGMSR